MVNQLLASATEVDITPPIGTNLAGYVARKNRSIGIHDPLKAQVLLLKSNDYQVVFITMDLLGIKIDFTNEVRMKINQAVGVPDDCILIACSHTHSGPVVFLKSFAYIYNKQKLKLKQIIEDKILNAAILASEKLRPARLGVGCINVEGICCNRNNPDSGPVDNEVIVIRVDDEYNKPIAVVMNYGCHPTVLGYKNLLISADFPGVVKATLNKIYPDTVFMYTNGASGDVSTRFTRREQTFNEAERLGNILAGEVLRIMKNIITQKLVNIESRIIPIKLKVRSLPSSEVAQQELENFQIELDKLKKIKHHQVI